MQYNTYYRKDVWERFKEEPNKSELVNELLAEHYGDPQKEEWTVDSEVPQPRKNNIPEFPGVKPAVEIFESPVEVLGYPCCQNEKKRCKHWSWDGTNGNWLNSLTGEVRE